MSKAPGTSKSSGHSEERIATRVDTAHLAAAPLHTLPLHGAVAEEPALWKEFALAAAGRSPAHAEFQLQAQASQLGEYLQGRQAELDRREAQLNAEGAEFEKEVRTARLWLREQTELLEARTAQFNSAHKELEERLNQLAIAAESAEKEAAERALEYEEHETQIRDKRAELRLWETQLHQRARALQAQENVLSQKTEQVENEILAQRQQFHATQQAAQHMLALAAAKLEKHRTELEQREQRLGERARKVAQIDNVQHWQEELTKRRLQIHQAEQLHREQQEQLDLQRRKLAEEQAELWRRAAEQSAAWDERATAAEKLWKRRRQALNRRAEQLDQRRAAVEALYEETMQTHAETLEMRLAIDQLWLELQGAHPPAALTQSLAEARRKLTEHSQQAYASLRQQREEVQSLVARLAEQQSRLQSQREELEQWAKTQHQHVEEQAARLVAREQALDLQERRFHERERSWAEEKRDLQQRLREAITQTLGAPLGDDVLQSRS